MSAKDLNLGILSPEDIDLLCQYGVRKTYLKNTLLINEGDPDGYFYVILEGRVKVFVSDGAGRDFILNIQGPGEYFGELSILAEAPRSASVITLETTCVSMVSSKAFRECIATHPDLAMKIIRTLCQRVRGLTACIKSLAMLKVYDRIISTLEKLAVWEGDTGVIEEHLTHHDIASMVGASREMVSRILKDLIATGYIQIKDKKILINKELLSTS